VLPTRDVLIWSGIAALILIPLGIALASPLLAYRVGIYIAAGFAGIVALALMLLQPLLAGGYLPGLAARMGRRVHRWIGAALVIMVVAHVVGLWITSAPDVIDALLFQSPTPFSVWGVIAMWAVFVSAIIAAFRTRLRLSPKIWRLAHTSLAIVIVLGSVMHAWLVDGAMGTMSKAALCLAVLGATTKVLLNLKPWRLLRTNR
jgi:predicted ferric reductase